MRRFSRPIFSLLSICLFSTVLYRIEYATATESVNAAEAPSEPAAATAPVPVTYNVCIKDNSNTSTIQINSATGEYKYRNCGEGITITGDGSVSSHGCDYTLTDNNGDRRVTARWSCVTLPGTASLQMLSFGTTFTITDSNTTNNACPN